MERSRDGERLLWHGFLLFLLGLVAGFAVPAVANPRMGLSAHLEGVMNGLFLVALGLVWQRLTLSARQAAALFWLAIYGTYVNWASTLTAAVLGTSRNTPIAGAGFSGEPWAENLVDFGLFSLSVAIVAACILTLYGLRAKPPVERAAPMPA
jgi:(hydroxyamino)benzene mutase